MGRGKVHNHSPDGVKTISKLFAPFVGRNSAVLLVFNNMTQRFCIISIIIIELFCLSLAVEVYAKDKHLDSSNDLVVYFKFGTFEIEQGSLNDLFSKLDPSMFHKIQGYSCSSDKGSKEELLSEADKRAEIVKEHLIRKDFSANKLTTIAYDHSSECKVTLIIVE